MDTGVWIDRIEAAVDDPARLEEIRGEVAQDDTLSADDRQVLDGRIGTYLADHKRPDMGDPALEGDYAGA